MFKILIAVVNCHTRPEFSDVIRSTWGPTVPSTADMKFFLGRGPERDPKEDEVFLDCDDSYQGLPNKVQEIVKWAYIHGYDYVLKCDDDVVVKTHELLASDFTNYDFTGGLEPACKQGEIQTPFGFCYWLSRKAMALIVDAPLPGQPGSTHKDWHGNDEAWISTVLYINSIILHPEPRYYMHRGAHPVPKKVHPRQPPRPVPMTQPIQPNAFAVCMYLNMSGWHMTPNEQIIEEFKNTWSILCHS